MCEHLYLYVDSNLNKVRCRDCNKTWERDIEVKEGETIYKMFDKVENTVKEVFDKLTKFNKQT